MELSKTDTARLIRLLAACADIIDKHCTKAAEQDKARQCRQLKKKIIKRMA